MPQQWHGAVLVRMCVVGPLDAVPSESDFMHSSAHAVQVSVSFKPARPSPGNAVASTASKCFLRGL